MPDPAKSRPTARQLAQKIARELFTNGMGERAERLVHTDAAGRDRGGWCEEAVANVIEDALDDVMAQIRTVCK